MQAVVRTLGDRDFPVLASTLEAMRALKRNEDKVSAREISRVVLRDPLMTLKALRFAEANRGAKQSADITTVEHAVMMHGINRFLRAFANLTSVESMLERDPVALHGVRHVISRAQHAAAFARAIATQRHDIESDEVIIGALLHDLADLMLWLHDARAQAQLHYLLEHARGLRSAAMRRFLLGFSTVDLQLGLAHAWRLPELLCRLMDDDHAEHPRVVNVMVATRLARHLSHGWHDPALPDDYAAIEKLTGSSPDGARRLVRNASLQAARLWRDTGVTPVAAWIPLDHGLLPPVENDFRPSGRPDLPAFKAALAKLAAAPLDGDADAAAAWCLYALQFGLGLKRAVYAEAEPGDVPALRVRFAFDSTGDAAPWEGLSMPLAGTDLLSRVCEKMQGVWAGGANRERLAALLPPEQRARIGTNEFLVMSVFTGGHLRGLLIADQGSSGEALPDSLYAPFKALCLLLAKRLSDVR